jgi:cysteine desulfurase
MKRPVYLDCNATTPLEPEVWQQMRRFFEDEYGNEGSRTHDFGVMAKRAVQNARDEVGELVKCQRDEVIFTSGATEANNLAILGLAEFGEKHARKHIISTRIEHKAVLEPLEELAKRGFEITLVSPNREGWIDPGDVARALRPDTLLVSMMHANNETGVIQPVQEVMAVIADHPAYFHIDAAQTFGKLLSGLVEPRVDLISISGHKIYGPKGIGALLTRKRGYKRPPLTPLLFGGGQERGLRPGTLPVPLIVGLGTAAKLALRDQNIRLKRWESIRNDLKKSLLPVGAHINGAENRCLPHVVNVSFPGIDSEALMVALKSLAAFSNGSACTSASYKPSHVLKAMGLSDGQVAEAVRFSWCHLTPDVAWDEIADKISRFR